MKDYYSLLEVDKSSTEAEIKRAYFRMIRKYPPDRMPEDFKRIREAYEVLIDEHTRKEYDAIQSMPGIVQLHFNNGKKALEEGDTEKAVQLLKKVTKAYPDYTVLNSLLGDACLANGNSGSAVQIFKKLVRQEPANAGFAGKLAHAYRERGWYGKAIEQYEHALSLDEDNISLWDGLIQCHIEEHSLRTAKRTACKAISVSKQNNWDGMYIYSTLIQLDIMLNELNDLNIHLEEIKELAEKYTDNKDNMAWFLANIGKTLQQFGRCELAASMMETAHILLPEEGDIRSALTDIRKERDLRQILQKLYDDSSFPEYMAPMLDLELDMLYGSTGLEDTEFEIFLWEMDIVYEINAERKYVKLLKEKYPELFCLKEEFFNRVLDISQTKKLYWEYEKKLKKYSKLYPGRFENNEEDDWFLPREPVRREGPKIGRNDPCPCGSGKKYKKCCGA